MATAIPRGLARRKPLAKLRAYGQKFHIRLSLEARRPSTSKPSDLMGKMVSLSMSKCYKTRYIATIIIEDDSFTLLGGMEEKRQSRAAKLESNFCYVKDVSSRREVRLILSNGEWVIDNI